MNVGDNPQASAEGTKSATPKEVRPATSAAPKEIAGPEAESESTVASDQSSQVIQLAPGVGVQKDNAEQSITAGGNEPTDRPGAQPSSASDPTTANVNRQDAARKGANAPTAKSGGRGRPDAEVGTARNPIDINDVEISPFEAARFNTGLSEKDARIYVRTNIALGALKWPTRSGLAHEDGWQLFTRMWNMVVGAEPDLPFVQDIERVRMMKRAIQPPALCARVKMAMRTGKARQSPSTKAEQWRIDARRDSELMLRVVEEQALLLDKEEKLLAIILPGRLGPTATNLVREYQALSRRRIIAARRQHALREKQKERAPRQREADVTAEKPNATRRKSESSTVGHSKLAKPAKPLEEGTGAEHVKGAGIEISSDSMTKEVRLLFSSDVSDCSAPQHPAQAVSEHRARRVALKERIPIKSEAAKRRARARVRSRSRGRDDRSVRANPKTARLRKDGVRRKSPGRRKPKRSSSVPTSVRLSKSSERDKAAARRVQTTLYNYYGALRPNRPTRKEREELRASSTHIQTCIDMHHKYVR